MRMIELMVQCPYCGELIELALEVDLAGALVQDCEVCCRPWSVVVGRDDEGLPTVTVERT